MITEQIANELNLHLQRIFCLPITRSTFRDLQQVIVHLTQGNQERAQELFELLLSGSIKDDKVDRGAYDKVKGMVEKFTIPCRMSKEVFERGDFMGGISSEMLVQDNNAVFINRIRNIDGKELQFITDPQATLYLIHHFVTRLEELKKDKRLNGFKKEIWELKARLEVLQNEEEGKK